MPTIQNPPPANSGRPASNGQSVRIDWYEVADLAKANPGEWIKVDGLAHSANAYQVRTAHLVAFRPAGAFEATLRNRDKEQKGRAELYVRFIGTTA